MDDRDQEPLAPDLEALLEAERDAPGPPEGARERVLERVDQTVAAGPGPSGGGSGSVGGLGGLAAKAVGAALVVAGGVWLATTAPEQTPEPAEPAQAVAPAAEAVRGAAAEPLPTAPVPAVAPEVAEPVAAGRLVGGALGAQVPPPEPAPVAEPAPATPPAKPDRAEPAMDLGAERRILDRARAARSGGRAEAALAALAEHRRRFPRGALEEERDVLHLRILDDQGREAEVRTRAERFLRRHPRSIHRGVVEGLLEGSSP